MKKWIAFTAPAALAACAHSDVARYACEDGSTVEAAYDGDAATLSHEAETIRMTVAISASGARYVGDGWQWWTKGTDKGTLAPLAPGETIASARGVDCTTS